MIVSKLVYPHYPKNAELDLWGKYLDSRSVHEHSALSIREQIVHPFKSSPAKCIQDL